MSTAPDFTLANRSHLELFVALLLARGQMCHACGYATRATSKNWARCKKCGERVRRVAPTTKPKVTP